MISKKLSINYGEISYYCGVGEKSKDDKISAIKNI